MFLERSPYVSWAKQLPAFRHPAFTGVVHPDLPIWAGEPNPPPEPAPEPVPEPAPQPEAVEEDFDEPMTEPDAVEE